ncbi:MAG: diguanylate cyclase [Oscillospiraceae bacterium]|nr:diguanylate cyclase [Oscillospiraceae bacterium]
MDESIQKQTILIIDDEPTIIHALSQILLPRYEVKLAKDGKSGIALARKYDIDLILLDIVMPNMSGFDVLIALKESSRTRDIPIILVTGSDSVESEEMGLSLGAVDFIRKPFAAAIVTLRVGLHLRLINQMRTIERFSLTDGLTEINNRRYYEQQLKAEWSRAIRKKTCLSLLMLDIDFFKLYNDKYGHLCGDLCLKTTAGVLKDSVNRGDDRVFRWGGEEFAVILPETPQEGAKAVAEKIRMTIAATPIPIGKENTYVTASIGVSTVFPSLESIVDDFCKVLDEALYSAKQNGRNRVEAMNM